MRYSSDVLDQIRQRLSIVEEVRSVATGLKRKGKFWWACCPFHQEKSPSFHVREDDGHYHCFGCGAHGDVFTFAMEAKGLTFTDAVEQLADKAGVTLPKIQIDPQAEKDRNDGFKALARAQVFYQRNLSEVSNYLEKRDLTQETISIFGLGYAPDKWTETREALATEGFTTEVLRTAGLSIQSDKGKEDYDRFRGRLMFPIHDLKDRVVAFGGRIVGEGEPKYLNSPDTPFFNKSHILYNLNRTREYIRKEGMALLVEGYMDAIALWQAGVKTAVAPMGTAVTADQIQLLWQYNAAPFVCLDGDSAGRSAAVRVAKRILPVIKPGKTLKFVWLPDGEDPDTYIKKNSKKAFLELLKSATSLEDVLWSDVSDGVDLKTGDGRAQVEEGIQFLIREIKDETVNRHYRQSLKDKLWQAGRQTNSKYKTNKQVLQGHKKWVPQTQDGQGERYVLAMAYKYPFLLAEFLEELSDISFENQGDNNLMRFLVQSFLERRVVEEAFQSYLETNGLKEQVDALYRQTFIDRDAELWQNRPDEIRSAFTKRLKQIRQQQRKAVQKAGMREAVQGMVTEDDWQRLQGLVGRS